MLQFQASVTFLQCNVKIFGYFCHFFAILYFNFRRVCGPVQVHGSPDAKRSWQNHRTPVRSFNLRNRQNYHRLGHPGNFQGLNSPRFKSAIFQLKTWVGEKCDGKVCWISAQRFKLATFNPYKGMVKLKLKLFIFTLIIWN